MKKILLTLSCLLVAVSMSASAPGTTIRRFTAPKTLAAETEEPLFKVTPDLTVDIPGGGTTPMIYAVPHNFTDYDYSPEEDCFERRECMILYLLSIKDTRIMWSCAKM